MTGEEKLRFMDRLSTLPRPAVEVDLPRLLGVERYRSKEIWETIPHLPYNVGKALGLALFVFDQGEKTPMARCAMIELMRLMAFLRRGSFFSWTPPSGTGSRGSAS